MSGLKQLGMKKNWIYEIIISSFSNHTPNAAPFGVKTGDFTLVELEMYKGSNTLKNIMAGKEFAINTVDDPVLIYQVLYDRDAIRFGSATTIQAPVLMDSPATIEARMIDFVDQERILLIKAEVLHIQIRTESELINRAKGLVLESLILSTRIPYFPEGKVAEVLKENYRVVRKVAPGARYENIMQALVNHVAAAEKKNDT